MQEYVEMLAAKKNYSDQNFEYQSWVNSKIFVIYAGLIKLQTLKWHEKMEGVMGGITDIFSV